MKVPEIKEELKKHGLRADGKKAELVARLEAHLANALNSVMAPASSPTLVNCSVVRDDTAGGWEHDWYVKSK